MNIIMGGDMEYEDLIGLTEFLKWKNVTTKRQKKNGTQIWELPIKIHGQFIKVGSFKRGYVRRMNGCYTTYQLNKCENYDHFYKEFKSHYNNNGDYKAKWTGKYNKMICRKRILIEDKRDRLEYLIDYCLKNYYIKPANQVENGEFVHKWQHEYEMKNGSIDKVRELQSENNRLHNIYLKQTTEITELKEEIDKINDYNYDKIEGLNQEIRDKGALDNLTVFVNNEKYKII